MTTQRRKIGETRERTCWVMRGFYLPSTSSVESKNGHKVVGAELIEVSEDGTILIKVEILDYAYPDNPPPSRSPGWRLKGWREPTDEEATAAEADRRAQLRANAEELHEQAQQDRVKDATLHALQDELRIARMSWGRRFWYRIWHPFARQHALPPATVIED